MGTSVSKEEDDSRGQGQRLKPVLVTPVVSTTTSPAFLSFLNGASPVVSRAQCDAAPPPPPLPGDGEAPPPPPPDSIETAASMVSAIPNPGPYEHAAMEGKRLVSLDTFDGMRFDINKQLSPYMAVVHSFWLGTSMIPDGRNKSYSFISQVASEDGMLFTRIDFDRGSVDGRIHRAILGGAAMGKLQLGLSKTGEHDQCLAEVDFGGLTWTGNLKYGSMGGGLALGMNYFQSITPRLAMGGEGMYIAANGACLSNYTVKYTMPAKASDDDDEPLESGSVTPGMAPDVPSSMLCANFNAGQAALTLNYKRVVTPGRVTLGAELQCNVMDPSESQVLVGGEFKLTKSKVSLLVDGSGRIQSTVEAKLGLAGAPTIQFAGELDHYSNIMRFGYGLNIDG